MNEETPRIKPQDGIWTLTAPDGREFVSDSPLHCCRKEMETRIPYNVRLARIIAATRMSANKCCLCEEGEATQVLAEGTPAEIKVCAICAATIKDSLRRGDGI